MQPDDILEMLMLICFSTGWYWSIGFMIITRRPCGKSGVFVLCTIVGYVLGLIAKLWAWQTTQEISYLLLVYCWNLSIASLDFALLCYISRTRQVPRQDMDFLQSSPPRGIGDPASLIHSGPILCRQNPTQAVRLDRL